MLFQIVSFFVYIGVPIYFLFRMLNVNEHDVGKWLLETILCGTYIACIFLIGIWPMTYGFFFKYTWAIAFFIIALCSAMKMKRPFTLEKSAKRIGLYVLTFSVCGILMTDIFFALNGATPPLDSVELDFPLKHGEFCIVQGGSSEIINHHYNIDAQKYALDIVRLNKFGLRASTLLPKELDDFSIYGVTVYSPCDGMVVELSDLYPDLPPSQMDPENPAGNFIAISKDKSDVIVILAHLMKGGFLVQKGEQIRSGQPLARVGNSGNTSEPHLHIHSVLNHTGDFLFRGKGIAMKFNDRFLIRNDRVTDLS